MSEPESKGKFSAEISQDVIQEALKSVKKHTSGEEVAPAPVADASAPAQGPLEAELGSVKAQLELSLAKGREMMEKVKDSHERMLRAVADLENYKKRAQKEKEEVQKYGIEKLLKDFLTVGDNLDRALEHASSPADFDSLMTGIKMTRKQFDDALAKHGVKSFSAKGKPFDPRLHEAMQQVETSEVPPGHVVTEVVRGYLINDRLARPAMVVLSVEPAKATASDSPPAPGNAVPEPSADAGQTKPSPET